MVSEVGLGGTLELRSISLCIVMSLHLRMSFGTSAGLAGMAEAQLASVACPGASAAVIVERSTQTDCGPGMVVLGLQSCGSWSFTQLVAPSILALR